MAVLASCQRRLASNGKTPAETEFVLDLSLRWGDGDFDESIRSATALGLADRQPALKEKTGKGRGVSRPHGKAQVAV